MMQSEAAGLSPYDAYLPCLLEKEGLERIEALLSDMLTKAQAELERLNHVPA
jgi:hypothetical protein